MLSGRQYKLHTSLFNSIFKTNSTKKYINLFSLMVDNFSSSSKGDIGNDDSRDHLRVTSNEQRDSEAHYVKVIKIRNLSPTVKELVLRSKIHPPPFHFKAGQWVDTFIPGVDKVGGFSMTSSPTYLRKTGNLHLAVKYSEHPPARWVHSAECRVGSEVSIRVGGNFYLDVLRLMNPEEKKRLLLIAGGVGINPLASMVAEIKDATSNEARHSDHNGVIKTALMFSARKAEELLFREQFDALAEVNVNFKPIYFLTGTNNSTLQLKDTYEARIDQSHIERTLNEHLELQPHSSQINNQLLAYICGPPSMITSLESILKSIGVKNIYFENWWQ